MSTVEQLLRPLVDDGTTETTLNSLPYTRFLGLHARLSPAGLMIIMPYSDQLIGSPYPPRLHGGTVGALLETAGALTLCLDLMRDGQSVANLPKSITLTVDYLRAGREFDTFAMATITRRGRRVANVRAEAWQDDRTRLIAAAHLNLLIE
jgi:uncharacterized protein (TIGR00369 family)